MRRLTRGDWQLINEGLALLEASIDDLYLTEEEEAEREAAIAATRAKVFERLDGRGQL